MWAEGPLVITWFLIILVWETSIIVYQCVTLCGILYRCYTIYTVYTIQVLYMYNTINHTTQWHSMMHNLNFIIMPLESSWFIIEHLILLPSIVEMLHEKYVEHQVLSYNNKGSQSNHSLTALKCKDSTSGLRSGQAPEDGRLQGKALRSQLDPWPPGGVWNTRVVTLRNLSLHLLRGAGAADAMTPRGQPELGQRVASDWPVLVHHTCHSPSRFGH